MKNYEKHRKSLPFAAANTMLDELAWVPDDMKYDAEWDALREQTEPPKK